MNIVNWKGKMGKGLLTSALISFELVQTRECIRGLCADTKTKRF
jgi:hypothetical protein